MAKPCLSLASPSQLIILEAHSRKKAEDSEFRSALAAALAERDQEGRAVVAQYDKVHKHVMRAGSDGNPAAVEEQVSLSRLQAYRMCGWCGVSAA